MVRKQKLYYSSFKFMFSSKEEEIELIAEILNESIKNNSQFSCKLYEKYPSLINAIDTTIVNDKIRMEE